jgi:hypothetical protein
MSLLSATKSKHKTQFVHGDKKNLNRDKLDQIEQLKLKFC